MIRTFKSVYVSAPTSVAVDNIASRMYETSRRVVETANGSMESVDPKRLRRLLVIRGYKPDDEMAAFLRLLQNPDLGDQAAPESAWRGASRWKLHLSLAYWALKTLRSQAVEPLHQDDSTALYQLQARIDNRAEWAVLRGVAAGDQPWEDYEAQPLTDNQVKGFLRLFLDVADAVATTPALSCQMPYKRWKDSKGHAVVIDEAGNIRRPDLYSVWGNTMIPLFLAGDEKQLPPAVMSAKDKDDDGNALNRHALDAGISALGFFKGTGWPVFRLRTQLRMARGLFTLSHTLFYSDVPCAYDPRCDIASPAHAVGRLMENFVRSKFAELRPSPPNELREVFVHCPGSECKVDANGSHSNLQQAQIAVALLDQFVRAHRDDPRVDPANIGIITPYKANVATINRQLQNYDSLQGVEPATTVDSFQGHEASIMVLILGTTEKTGPGFSADEQRLNVALSRQKSYLLIVGDINVTGPVVAPAVGAQAGARAGRGRGGRGGGARGGAHVPRATDYFQVVRGNEVVNIRAVALRGALLAIQNAGRVATFAF
ncbi:hypothetical protein J3458_019809 [Metarhizium acridum]|uniref:uncharacterized protein n=1 Tax=Metarhizium acridum TaxID=92637 RepID=UPI001C6C3B9B|nr:hypothetical protein J3458_019809 [Metarhizium acridum]